MDTLRKMQAQGCGLGYPAHGIVIADLRAKIAGELAQKLRRERQVLKALVQNKLDKRGASQGGGNGSVTVQQLVAATYMEAVEAGFRELALEPFMDKVLRKLAEDSIVAFEVRRGVKKWFALEEFRTNSDYETS
ncbi:hypothetical protein N7449_008782 [Penicillium cf. viridicatum]|uniref:Uncharacterized protein n=1 Tax=Penicillium cf. viridicatum TaxID=2972119 RepID=A0A9W9M7Z7_9EURO|nr:hypothetical protein N7449_008782 [Penicillium cf. viridicatum]